MHFGNHNLAVLRRDSVLLCRKQLLIELFAVAKSSELNLNILGSRERNHSSCQVNNLHRLAHIEHKYLASLAHCACLKHQLTSLRDEHEVAYYVGMGHSNGSTLAYKFLEYRYNRTVRTEHIAKTGCNKLCHTLHSTINNSLIERLAVNLADTL